MYFVYRLNVLSISLTITQISRPFHSIPLHQALPVDDIIMPLINAGLWEPYQPRVEVPPDLTAVQRANLHRVPQVRGLVILCWWLNFVFWLFYFKRSLHSLSIVVLVPPRCCSITRPPSMGGSEQDGCTVQETSFLLHLPEEHVQGSYGWSGCATVTALCRW